MSAMTPNQAIEWVAELFDEEPGNLSETSAREDIVMWDSMGMLLLMGELDSDFDVQLEEEQLANLQSIGDLFTLLRGQGVITD